MNDKSSRDLSFSPNHTGRNRNDEERVIELSEIISLLKGHKFFIAGLVLLGVLFAAVYSATISQKYETNALIQVQSSSNETQGMLQNLGASGVLGGVSQNLSSIIESSLVKSRYILQPVVESLGLNVSVAAKYFPVIGVITARHYKGNEVSKPFLGMNSYAWGGEKIAVRQFIVPPNLWGKRFKIVARELGKYSLYDENNRLVLSGLAGKISDSGADSAVPNVRILLSDLQSNVGTTFFIQANSVIDAVDVLSNNISINDLGMLKSGMGQQGSTGVLQISLQGTNSVLLPSILNTIVFYEIQRNVDKKTAEAEKTLEFLDQQSKLLKNELDKAETNLSIYKSRRGALDVTVLGQALLAQMTDVSKSIEALKLRKTQMLQDFTAEHPYIIALDREQAKLHEQLSSLENRASNLPKAEQEVIGLTREVRVKDQLYLLLLSKIQELQIVKAGTISDARVLANATLATPIPAKTSLIILAGALFGFVLALAIVFLRYFIHQGLDDPDYLEERLGVPLFAIIPFSKGQERLTRKKGVALTDTPSVLAAVDSKDLAIEGLRSLRTILQLNLRDAGNNIVAILGATPALGKSFVSLNLAYVLADSGKKVLLIDADLRRGRIHQHLRQVASPGLAEILANKASVSSVKRTLREGSLDFIAAGHYPENPSELLFDDKFEKLISSISKQYDIVIIDTPPVLLVSDGIIIAKQAGIHLLVLGSGTGSVKEIEHAKKRLQKNNVHIDGLVFNSSKEKAAGYGSYGSYGGYYYDNNDKKQQ
ncbi:MAG: polysaccharide biosynthesis tyrosine autokinase [Gammaproteobacteria bacterium]